MNRPTETSQAGAAERQGTAVPEPSPTLLFQIARHYAERPEHVLYRWVDYQGTETHSMTYRDLWERSTAVARQLLQSAEPGDRVMLCYPFGLEYIIGFLGCLRSGMVVVSAFPPNPHKLEQDLPRYNAAVADAGATLALTDSVYHQIVEASRAFAGASWATEQWLCTDTLSHDPEPLEAPEPAPEDLCLLQYTSGSTGVPKAVMLPYRSLTYNVQYLSRYCRYTEETIGVSWVPVYHDMGLFGPVLSTMWKGCQAVMFSPLDFIQNPVLWRDVLQRYSATTTVGPNFSYGLLAKRLRQKQQSVDLSFLKFVCFGGEPVDPEVIDVLTKELGVRGEALFNCYGMAEVGLFVSVASAHVHEGVVACADPSLDSNIAFRLDDDGRILIRGPHLALGYWNRPASAFLEEDWYPTGDLGFLHDGLIYVNGRQKDLLIINGRNVYPHDIERLVEIHGEGVVRPGCSAAFQLQPTTAGICLERHPKQSLSDDLLQALRAAVQRECGVALERIWVLNPGQVPKTSSGKLKRADCARRCKGGEWGQGWGSAEDLFEENWNQNILDRQAYQGNVFKVTFGDEMEAYHAIGRDAVEAVFDPVRCAKGRFLGTVEIPESLFPEGAGSLFTNGQEHDRYKSWTVIHLRQATSRITLTDLFSLIGSHVERWTHCEGTLKLNQVIDTLAAELAVLLLTGTEWPGVRAHLTVFAEALTECKRTGRIVETQAELVVARKRFFDFFRRQGITDPRPLGLTQRECHSQLLGVLLFAAWPALSSVMASLVAMLSTGGLKASLRDEVDDAWPGLAEILEQRQPLVQHLIQDTWAEACPALAETIRSALRSHPSVHYVAGYARTDLVLGDTPVPKGALILADLYHTMAQEVPDGGVQGLMFGLGRLEDGRLCPAERLSEVVLFALSSLLLRGYSWEPEVPITWELGHVQYSKWPCFSTGFPVRDFSRRASGSLTGLSPGLSSRVAVVGGGAAGLSAAYALCRAGHQVTIYEKAKTIGGHACTKAVLGGRHQRDPAFGAFRKKQWPNFWALLETLNVVPVSHGRASDWFQSPFVGWFRADQPVVLQSDAVMEKGHAVVAAFAAALEDPRADGRTIGDFLSEHEVDDDFLLTYFLGGLIHYFAGHSLEYYLDYPLRLIAWMALNNDTPDDHGDVEIFRVYNAAYISAFEAYLKARGVRFETGVNVEVHARSEAQVSLRVQSAEGRTTETYRDLLLAVQPQQALKVLGGHASEEERDLLSQFIHHNNTVVVHEEAGWVPSAEADQRLLNIRLPDPGQALRREQTIPITIVKACSADHKTPVLATYAYDRADQWPETVDAFTFRHVQVTPKTQRLRQTLTQLQAQDSVSFCGSWTRGMTLHEDAVVSGLQCANRIMDDAFQCTILTPPVPLPEPFAPLSRTGAALAGLEISAVEAYITAVWNEVLGTESAQLSDNFFSLGGTSLKAGQLVSQLESAYEIALFSPQLFVNPTLGSFIARVCALTDHVLPDRVATYKGRGEDDEDVLHVLGLHGMSGNAQAMTMQLQLLLQPLMKHTKVAITCIDGPFEAPLDIADAPPGDRYAWFSNPEETGEFVWTAEHSSQLEASLERVHQALVEAARAGRRYAVIAGFSQGGILTNVISLLAAQGDPRFAAHFDLSLCLSSRLPTHMMSYFSAPEGFTIDRPALHIYNSKDPVFSQDQLAESYARYAPEGASRIVLDDEQHHLRPLTAQEGEALVAFFDRYRWLDTRTERPERTLELGLRQDPGEKAFVQFAEGQSGIDGPFLMLVLLQLRDEDGTAGQAFLARCQPLWEGVGARLLFHSAHCRTVIDGNQALGAANFLFAVAYPRPQTYANVQLMPAYRGAMSALEPHVVQMQAYAADGVFLDRVSGAAATGAEPAVMKVSEVAERFKSPQELRAIYGEPEEFEAVRTDPALTEGKVWVLNFLRFEAGEGPRRYEAYGAYALQEITEIGGGLRVTPGAAHALKGSAFDVFAIMEYPSREALFDYAFDALSRRGRTGAVSSVDGLSGEEKELAFRYREAGLATQGLIVARPSEVDQTV